MLFGPLLEAAVPVGGFCGVEELDSRGVLATETSV